MTGSRPPKPKRRWYQFSLRSLLIFVLLASAVFSWVGLWIRQVSTERKALANLGDSGAEVMCRLDGYVVDLRLTGKVGDDDLAGLRRFTKLHTLDLAASRFVNGRRMLTKTNQITDSGLVHLEQMRRLDWLSLRETQATDKGLVHLRTLTNLRVLNLEGLNITGDGLAHLKHLGRLDHLLLNGSAVTDAGLAHLKGMPIGWLEINYTRIGDDGLAYLRGMPSLELLEVNGTQVTDAGLLHLAEVPSLRMLWIRNTGVTDAGIMQLRRLNKLESLELDGTKVTHNGVKKLQQALPDCTISWTAPDPGLRAE